MGFDVRNYLTQPIRTELQQSSGQTANAGSEGYKSKSGFDVRDYLNQGGGNPSVTEGRDSSLYTREPGRDTGDKGSVYNAYLAQEAEKIPLYTEKTAAELEAPRQSYEKAKADSDAAKRYYRGLTERAAALDESIRQYEAQRSVWQTMGTPEAIAETQKLQTMLDAAYQAADSIKAQTKGFEGNDGSARYGAGQILDEKALEQLRREAEAGVAENYAKQAYYYGAMMQREGVTPQRSAKYAQLWEQAQKQAAGAQTEIRDSLMRYDPVGWMQEQGYQIAGLPGHGGTKTLTAEQAKQLATQAAQRAANAGNEADRAREAAFAQGILDNLYVFMTPEELRAHRDALEAEIAQGDRTANNMAAEWRTAQAARATTKDKKAELDKLNNALASQEAAQTIQATKGTETGKLIQETLRTVYEWKAGDHRRELQYRTGNFEATALSEIKKALLADGFDQQAVENTVETLRREINAEWQRQQAETLDEQMRRSGFGGWLTRWAYTLASVPMNLASPVGMLAPVATALNGSDYSTVDPNSAWFGPANAVNSIRETHQKYNAGGKVNDMLYGIITSSMDSVLGGMVGSGITSGLGLTGNAAAWVGGSVIGAEAAAQSMQDIAARGGSVDQVLSGGLMAGAFETLFEQFSLSQLHGLKQIDLRSVIADGKLLETIARNVGTGMLTNGSEELATELANVMYDTYTRGELSNYAESVERYMAWGLTEAEARKRTATDLANQVLEAGYTGALQGLLMDIGGLAAHGMDTWADPEARENGSLPQSAAADSSLIRGSQGTDADMAEWREGMRTFWHQDPDAAEQKNSAAPGEGTTAESSEPINVGKATTIQHPYKGITPVQTQATGATVDVPAESISGAQARINEARNAEAHGTGSFKGTLKGIYRAIFQRSASVPVSGMTYNGQPYLVEIGGKVPGKVINDPNLSPEKLALLDILPQVVENAEYVGSGDYVSEGKKSKPVTRYDYFETPVQINGKPYIAKFDVEVLSDRNNYRTHQIVNVDLTTPEGSLVGPAPTAASDGPGPRSVTSDVYSVPQPAQNSNTKNLGRDISMPAVKPQETTPQDLSLPAVETKAEDGDMDEWRERAVDWWGEEAVAAEEEKRMRDHGAEEADRLRREARQAEDDARADQEAEAETEAAERRNAWAERAGKQTERDTDTRKAPRSTESLKAKLRDIFSIQGTARSIMEANELIESFAEDAMRDGSISDKRLGQLFDALIDRGIVFQAADSYFSEFRKAVKGTGIYVDPSTRADFGEDWTAFKKRAARAGITLSTTDQSLGGIDVHAQELAEMFGGIDTGTDLRASVESIVDTAEKGAGQTYSQEEIDSIIRKQHGDQAADARIEDMRRKLEDAFRQFAESSQIEFETGKALTEKSTAAAKRMAERKALGELQQKTLKSLQWLQKNRNRAPADLRAEFDKVLHNIDTLAVSAADEMHYSKKHNATWRDLADMYKKAKDNDPNFLPSAELDKIVMRLDYDKIGQMDPGAVADLYKVASGLRTELYNRNNVIGDAMHTTFSEAYADSVREINDAKGGSLNKKGNLKKGQTFFDTEQLTPMNYIRRMVGWKDNSTFASIVGKGLEKGEMDYQRYKVDAEQLLEDFKKKHAAWIKCSDGQGKNAIWYEMEVPEIQEWHMGDKPIFGNTVKVHFTPAQKVYMALEAENYDNLRHMKGGRTFVNKELYSKGKRTEAFKFGTTIKLAPETVKKIVSDMTAEEKALFDIMKEYYNGYSKENINRVSNIVFGYDRAMTSNYARIYTNENYVGHEAGRQDTSVWGIGSLKERQQSDNPSYQISAWDAFDRHVDATGRFVGFAIPVRNAQTLMNWQGNGTSMRDTLSHKWGGDSGTKYIDDLLTNLQQSRISEDGYVDKEAGKLLSAYVSSVFAANPGIVLKQFASYPQVASILGWDTIPTKKRFFKVDTGLINKYTPILAYRMMGYATPETATLKNNPRGITSTKAGKFILGGGAITAMDGATVKRIWPWAENYVSKHFPELQKGTAQQIQDGTSPYYRKVAEVFNDAVSTTQPMYDTMHRANIMKNGKSVQRAFTMFKTVPLQQYNTLRRAIGEYQAATGDAKKQARRQLANTITATLVSAAGLELIEFANQWLKNGAKGYKDDDEDKLTAESVAEKFAWNMAGDLAGTVIFGSELVDAIEGLLTGGKIYGIEVPGAEQLDEIYDEIKDALGTAIDFATDAISIAKDGGDLSEYYRRYGSDYAGALLDISTTAAKYLGGMPVENIEKYFMGVLEKVSPKLHTEIRDYFDTPERTELKGMKPAARDARVYDILKNRYGNKAHEEAAQELSRLYETAGGSVIPGSTPDSVTVDGEQVKLDAAAKQRYDKAFSEASRARINGLPTYSDYQAMDDEAKAKYIKRIYEVAKAYGSGAAVDGYVSEAYTEKINKMLDAGMKISNIADVFGMKAALTNKQFAAWVDDVYGETTSKGLIEELFNVSGSYDRLTGLGLDIDQISGIDAAKEKYGDSPEFYDYLQKNVSSKVLGDVEGIYGVKGKAEVYLQTKGTPIAKHWEELYNIKSKTEGAKDEDGETIPGSKKLNVMLAIDKLDTSAVNKFSALKVLGYNEANPPWVSDYSGKDYETYYYMSDSGRKSYEDYCSWMKISDYAKYMDDCGELKTDPGKEKKSDPGKTRKEKVIDYIDALDLLPDQKSALFAAMGYAEKSLQDCPWYNPLALKSVYYPRF